MNTNTRRAAVNPRIGSPTRAVVHHRAKLVDRCFVLLCKDMKDDCVDSSVDWPATTRGFSKSVPSSSNCNVPNLRCLEGRWNDSGVSLFNARAAARGGLISFEMFMAMLEGAVAADHCVTWYFSAAGTLPILRDGRDPLSHRNCVSVVCTGKMHDA